MFEILFQFPFERIKEVLLHLKSKYFDERRAPRTIIGIEYYPAYLQGRAAERHFPAPIQKCVKDDNWERVGQAVAYGPFYQAREDKMWKTLKMNAWKNVLTTTGGKEDETRDLYFEAVRRVEDKSRYLYSMDESIDRLTSNEFVNMMVIDGCFLLQIALSVLGGSKRLDHLGDFPLSVPGRKDEKRTPTMIRVAVSSMFVVGNQIPLLVLRALMGQSFFKNFISRGLWEEPLDMERRVLFELLLVPMFHVSGVEAVVIDTESLLDHPVLGKVRGHSRWPMSIFKRRRSREEASRFIKSLKRFSASPERKKDPEKPTDLLHGLWLFMTGLVDSREDYVDDDDEDVHGDDSSTSSYDFVLPTVRSAKELKEVGVAFEYREGTRIDEIRFRKIMFNATLALPRIVVVSDTEMHMLFSNLMRYEVIHFGQSRRNVCEYLQLMRGLIRSPEDAKVLAAEGVILVDPNLEEKVPSIFQELDIPRLRSHRSPIKSLGDELNSYSRPSPFKKLGDVLSFVVLLTLIQTVYTVLGYHLKS